MGIVNVTPDSFSDGGAFLAPNAAVDHALALVEQGADILDVGGESTRPYSVPVSEREELKRLEPVLARLSAQTQVPLSIDTSKPRVAAMALGYGAEIINDITGLALEQMVHLAAESQCGVCAMHIRGTPQDMQDDPRYHDVVGEIFTHLAARRDRLVAAGVEATRICLDPGIGFGKTHEHNRLLIVRCDRFLDLGQPLLVGPSRKGFIARLCRRTTVDRLGGTIGIAIRLAELGIHVIRVHDVGPVREALDVYAATAREAGPNPR